ncbi:MAG TPA: hypothetical protein VF308_02835, partial [Caldimonas sp.]
EFDLNPALSVQRYGKDGNVMALGLVQPSLVLNAAFNDWPADNWQTNVELGATANIGAGRAVADRGKPGASGSSATGTPFSLTTTLGLGFTKAWGDYALSVEPFVQHDAFTNAAAGGSSGSFWDGGWTGGLKLGFTAINVPGRK